MSDEIRPRDIYRGKRYKHSWIPVVLTVFGAMILILAVALYSMQKYVVYTQDGLYIELPILGDTGAGAASDTHTQRPAVPGAAAQIIREDADFNTYEFTAGADAVPIKAVYVPFDQITIQGIESAFARLDEQGADTMVMELKNTSGMLAYVSATEQAVGFKLSGELDIAPSIKVLKDEDIYMIAELSCLADQMMATRNPSLAVRDSKGDIYSDEQDRYWLDPRNNEVVEYLSALMVELKSMGFDEVVFKNVRAPGIGYASGEPLPPPGTAPEPSEGMELRAHDEQGDNGQSGESHGRSPGSTEPYAVVSTFVMKLAKRSRDNKIPVSAYCEAETVEVGRNDSTGQDAGVFFKFFDRVYVNSTQDDMALYTSSAAGYVEEGEPKARVVMVLDSGTGDGSWVSKGLTPAR